MKPRVKAGVFYLLSIRCLMTNNAFGDKSIRVV